MRKEKFLLSFIIFCFYNFLWCRFLSFLFFLMLLLFIIIIIIIFHAQFGSFFRE